MKIDVAQHERVFVLFDNKPARYLAPGRYRIWNLFTPSRRVTLKRIATANLLADLDVDELALVPAADLQVLEVGPSERALVFHRGWPVRWLGRGIHQLWTVDGTVDRSTGVRRRMVTVERIDVRGVETQPLKDDVKAIVPASDYVEATAPQGSVALRYVDGALDAELPPGRHAAWTVERKVSFAVIDLREKLLNVAGQEVLTKDRVTLRLNLSAVFRVQDAQRLATVARAPDEVLYLAMQLAARTAVALRSLDELLQDRESLGKAMESDVRERGEAVGLSLVSFGVKDVILPGEMKELLNRVIGAQKEAEANVILRREETAATRSLAQTAKVLAENPLLVRLKELEAYKELAAKVGQVHLVLGEGQLPSLQLKA
jgi:regulator of protease activity HflC (stomatin/prohibitin superfamily)